MGHEINKSKCQILIKFNLKTQHQEVDLNNVVNLLLIYKMKKNIISFLSYQEIYSLNYPPPPYVVKKEE